MTTTIEYHQAMIKTTLVNVSLELPEYEGRSWSDAEIKEVLAGVKLPENLELGQARLVNLAIGFVTIKDNQAHVPCALRFEEIIG